MLRRFLFFLISVSLLTSCLTFYEKNLIFQERFAHGDFKGAEEILEKNKTFKRPKNELLYLLDKGVTLQLQGAFAESNRYFEEAYIYVQDFERNYGLEALSLITNENVKKYRGEDFEKIFIHYYKAMNYIGLMQPDEAMVEIRRINIRLNEFNDKYKKDSKYKRDAFAHTLMGLLYESVGDENNAFIAYRNAYEIYTEDYKAFFGLSAPVQLRKDLIRMAYLNGFYAEQERYEKLFGMKFDRSAMPEKEVVCLWHNGLGPIKDEWSFNFIVVKGQGGYVSFTNKELGMDFGFYTRSTEDHASLGDLKVVRVAFPKYVFRREVYTGARIAANGKVAQLEELEDVNKIAERSLKDRMIRELSKTLLRTALKQAAELALRNESEGWGAALSVLNAATEKADTRNWQTLPAHISYARLPVSKDTTTIEIKTFKGANQKTAQKKEVVVKGRLGFLFHTSISPEGIR